MLEFFLVGRASSVTSALTGSNTAAQFNLKNRQIYE